MTVENGPYDHEQVESLDMAAKEGICFLTRVEGPMDGGGEQAFVYVEDGQWQLKVTGLYTFNMPSAKQPKATATCYGYDQQSAP